MAEAIGLAASIIAVVQISDTIVRLCKMYIQDVQEASSDMHVMFLEVSSLRTLFENLQFLESQSAGVSKILQSLSAETGPVNGCRQAVTMLEDLLSPDISVKDGGHSSKKRKIKATWRTLGWPFKAGKAKKLLADIGQYKNTISLAIAADSSQDVKDIKAKTIEISDALTENQRREFIKWLQHTDPTPHHQQACQSYEDGTGKWMLRTPEWTSWLNGQIRCVWVNGIPGAGKTFLMSFLAREVEAFCSRDSGHRAAIYYYCHFGRDQDETAPLLRWIVSQLCKLTRKIPDMLRAIYFNACEPSLSELSMALCELLTSFEIVYILVDALDESKSRERLLQFLGDAITDPRMKKLQFLFTSRNYSDIESSLRDISQPVSMANFVVEADIRQYVQSLMRSSNRFATWSPDLRNEVEKAVSEGAGGMFRWAYCQIHIIGRLERNIHVIRKHLRNLPKDLFEVYKRILDAVPEDDRLFVQHALHWIRFDKKISPFDCLNDSSLLTAIQLSTTLIRNGKSDRFYNVEICKELFGCLVDIKTCHGMHGVLFAGQTHQPFLAFYFSHKSVQDYLDHDECSKMTTRSLTDCQNHLSPIFVSVIFSWILNHHDLAELSSQDSDEKHFSEYCLGYVPHLLRELSEEISQDDKLFYQVLDLFDPSKPHFGSWTLATEKKNWTIPAMTRGLKVESPDAEVRRNVSIIASFNCLGHLAFIKKFWTFTDIDELLCTQVTMRSRLCKGRILVENPEALVRSDSLLEFLLESRIDDSKVLEYILANAKGSYNASRALFAFLKNPTLGMIDDTCSCRILDLLIRAGADVNTKSFCVTLLQLSVWYCVPRLVARLLEAGADPNDCGNPNSCIGLERWIFSDKDFRGWTPLWIVEEMSRDIAGSQSMRWRRFGFRAEVGLLLSQYGAKAINRANQAIPETTTSPPTISTKAKRPRR